MRREIALAIISLALLSMLVPINALASYAQFCRLQGEIVSEPEYSDCCVEFEFLVEESQPYSDPTFGAGWDDCDEHIGQQVIVKIPSGFLGEQDFVLGLHRLLWRDAIDMEVDGEICTIVGFSGVEPERKPVKE